MAKIKGYQITCTEAYSIWEQGTGYSLSPWGNDTPYYKGYGEEIDIELAEGCEVAESQSGEALVYQVGERIGMPLSAAIAVGLARVM